jgi:hypothetical protein
MRTTGENNPCKKSRHRGGQVDSMRSRLTRQCRWARVRDTQDETPCTWPGGSGKKRREARSRVHSSGWPEQFRFRSQPGTAPKRRPGLRDTFPSAPGFVPAQAQPHCPSLPFLSPLRRFHLSISPHACPELQP